MRLNSGERIINLDADFTITESKAPYDATIVGAGPAGLNCALLLARCCRKVFICDDRRARNAASHALHGFLSRDGVDPMELRALGLGEIRTYPNVHFEIDSAISASKLSDHFEVRLASGNTVRSRMLVLATGVQDILPDIPGFKHLYGKHIFHCPYCDGWEQRDRPIAVYGRGEHGKGLALELTQWSRDIVLCTDGPSELPEVDLQRLKQHGIAITEKRICGFEPRNNSIRIHFLNDEILSRSALFFSTGQYQRSPLAEELGCKFDEHGAIATGKYEATNVPGLFAVGDASRLVQLAIVAAAEGAQAAFAVNTMLLKDDLRRAERELIAPGG